MIDVTGSGAFQAPRHPSRVPLTGRLGGPQCERADQRSNPTPHPSDKGPTGGRSHWLLLVVLQRESPRASASSATIWIGMIASDLAPLTLSRSTTFSEYAPTVSVRGSSTICVM